MQNQNNIEVELKFSLQGLSLSELQGEITQLQFTSHGRRYEKTAMYDNRDFLMQKTDGRIRLRISGDSYELSYKKPIKDDSGIKKEIEYNCGVENPEMLSKILNTMDYHEVSSYERYRTTYHNNNKDIQITIDEFPFDTFLEIEGNEEGIINIAQKLGFTIKDNLSKPCDTLFNERRRSLGMGEKMIMSFEDYDLP